MKHQRTTPEGATIDDEQLRAIVAQIADGIIVVDDEGRVRFANPAAAQLFERSTSELVGQLFGFPVLDGERTEIDLLGRNGAVRSVEMRVTPLSWDGQENHLIALRDTTEQRQAQSALRDAQAFNWAILNSLSNHIAVIEETGEIVAVNDAWLAFARVNGDPDLRLTGVGTNYFAACLTATGDDAGDAARTLEGMRSVLQGSLPAFEMEYLCHTRDGERWFIMRAVPLQSDQRRGLVIAHTDITEQKQAARLAAEAEALREQVRAMGRELDNVEHLVQPTIPAPAPAALRERDPSAFQACARRYGEMLDEALRRRIYRIDDDELSRGLRDLAARLGTQGATPRDLIAMHLAMLHERSQGAPVARLQAYLEEGRVMALELMGHLAGYYRARALDLNDDK